MKSTWFLLGLAAGATAALVFAPQSGEETREILSEKVNKGRQYFTNKSQEVGERLSEVVDEGKKAVRGETNAVAESGGASTDTYQSEAS